MSNERRMYRMTDAQRQAYVMKLLSGRTQEALAFREECDAYWTAHPDEWEQTREFDSQGVRL